MKTLSRLVINIFICMIAFFGLASIIQADDGWIQNPENGHYYKLTPEKMSLSAAETLAQSWGGHLVTVNNKAENDWLRGNFGTNQYFIIGLVGSGISWGWLNGEPVTYTNWYDGEPNNRSGEGDPEDTVVMNWGGSRFIDGKWVSYYGDGWNDVVGTYQGIVEKSPLEVDAGGPYVGEVDKPVTVEGTAYSNDPLNFVSKALWLGGRQLRSTIPNKFKAEYVFNSPGKKTVYFQAIDKNEVIETDKADIYIIDISDDSFNTNNDGPNTDGEPHLPVPGPNLFPPPFIFGNIITPGATIQKTINVPRYSPTLLLGISWPGSDLDLFIRTPSGKYINPQIAKKNPYIHFKSEPTYEYYTFNNPFSGVWKIDIIARIVPEQGENFITFASYYQKSKDKTRPRTFARKLGIKSERKRKIARLLWGVTDDANNANVKLKILKRVRHKKRGFIYKTVKIVNYRMTTINKWKTFEYKTNSEGRFRLLVYAKDPAGNNQKNIAKLFFRTK